MSDYTLHRYLKEAGMRTIPSSLPDFRMTYAPRKQQITGLNMVMRYPRFGLYDKPGAGKTMIMQALALVSIAMGTKVVCLMPPVLLDQFIETINENFINSHRWLTWQILDGGKGPAWRERKFKEWSKRQSWPAMLLMTYEMFTKLHQVLDNHEYHTVITDEAQKLRGSESIFHLTLMNYTEDTSKITFVPATGSPIHHTLLDGYAMTRLTNRDAYGTFEGYKRQHTDRHTEIIKKMARNRSGKKRLRKIKVEVIDNFKDLGLLNRNLYKYARRVEKVEGMSLEAPTIIPMRLNMHPAHRTLYDTMSKEKMLEMDDGRVITGTEASALRQHLMGIACNPNRFSEKPIQNVMFDAAVQLIDSIGPGKKVALYAHHNETIEALSDELERRLDKDGGGWPEAPLLIYGGLRSSPSKNRRAADLFKHSQEHKLLIGHPISGGVGLDLQKVCHHLIIVEPTQVHGDFEQVLARFQRSGQPFPVLVYVLLLNGTVYPKMVENMLDNNELASTVNVDSTTLRRWVTGGIEPPPF